MNPLEELNEAIKTYNEAVRAYAILGDGYAAQQLAIERLALDILGLKPLKVRRMLAKVKVEVTFPKAAVPDKEPTLAEAGTYVAPDCPAEDPDGLMPPKFLREQKDQQK